MSLFMAHAAYAGISSLVTARPQEEYSKALKRTLREYICLNKKHDDICVITADNPNRIELTNGLSLKNCILSLECSTERTFAQKEGVFILLGIGGKNNQSNDIAKAYNRL